MINVFVLELIILITKRIIDQTELNNKYFLLIKHKPKLMSSQTYYLIHKTILD